MAPPIGSVAAIAVAILAILGGLYTVISSPCSSFCSSSCPTDESRLHTGYFGYECAGKPHHSSWNSWWHAGRSDGMFKEHGQGAGATTKDWNILYHLGGNGPWVEKVIDVVDGGIAVPKGCEVEQVHMVR